jgi:hypothetical protein
MSCTKFDVGESGGLGRDQEKVVRWALKGVRDVLFPGERRDAFKYGSCGKNLFGYLGESERTRGRARTFKRYCIMRTEGYACMSR